MEEVEEDKHPSCDQDHPLRMIDNCHNNRRYYKMSMLYDVVAFVVIMVFVFLRFLPSCVSREELPLCRDGHDVNISIYRKEMRRFVRRRIYTFVIPSARLDIQLNL